MQNATMHRKGTVMNLTLERYRRLIFAPLKALFRRPRLRTSRMLHRSATA